MADSALTVYTDGSCMPNPGPGGWAIIAIVDDQPVSYYGYKDDTTNNYMETYAVIMALQAFPNRELNIHSDSQYVINCAEGKYKPKKNRELWDFYYSLAKDRLITFTWVKAHNGDELNELVDQLAKKAGGQKIEKLPPSDEPDQIVAAARSVYSAEMIELMSQNAEEMFVVGLIPTHQPDEEKLSQAYKGRAVAERPALLEGKVFVLDEHIVVRYSFRFDITIKNRTQRRVEKYVVIIPFGSELQTKIFYRPINLYANIDGLQLLFNNGKNYRQFQRYVAEKSRADIPLLIKMEMKSKDISDQAIEEK